MSFGHALYYPHINLTNKNWLKHALLFWDELSRIVPSSVIPSDNEDIIKIRSETNFIKDHSPDGWEISKTFNQFSVFLEDFIDSDKLFTHFRREINTKNWRKYQQERKMFRDDYEFRREIIRAATLSNGSYIHIAKIDWRLKEKLFNFGLAIPGENEWEDWVKIDNEIGYLYMTFLAKSISDKRSLPLVTDTEEFFSASTAFNLADDRNYGEEFKYKIGNLLISSVVPKNINSITIDKILEIREKYSEERINFFNSITELSQNIPDIDNELVLLEALRHYESTLKNQTLQLKSAYDINKIETITKFLSISVPSILVSLSSYIPVQYQSVGVGAGLLFGVSSSLAGIKKERDQLRQKPLSYLLSINSELSGDNLLRKINDGIRGIRRW